VWKASAEQAAAAALTRRRRPPSTSEGVFLEAERLMPALIAEMRRDVQSDETELVRELVPLPSPGVASSPMTGHVSCISKRTTQT
jgi:hypothetical protein